MIILSATNREGGGSGHGSGRVGSGTAWVGSGRVGSDNWLLKSGRVGSGPDPGGSGRVGSEKLDPGTTLIPHVTIMWCSYGLLSLNITLTCEMNM